MYRSSVSRRISVARHSRLCVLKTKSYMQRSHLQGHSVMFVSLQKWGGWAAPPLLPE